MLTHLSIKNILLLKSCEIDFAAGLNVLTGETGAGKSILLDALGLVLGERSDATLVRAGETQAQVTAEFDISEQDEVKALLTELELPVEETLLLRRSLSTDGKSRAFANDAAVSVGGLKRLGELLVARHGQHDQRGLLDSKTHRTLLDAHAGNAALLTKAAKAFVAWKQATAELEGLRASMSNAAQEEEWLRMQVKELETLAPRAGEETELVELRQKAQTAKQSIGHLQQALEIIHAGSGIAPQLRQAAKALLKTDAESIREGIERAEVELEEATVALEKLVESAEIDPEALEKAEDRLHALRDASRKYRVPVEGLEELLAGSQVKLKQISNFDAAEKALSAALKESLAAYRTASEALHASREKAGASLTKVVMKELAPLKMGSTQLRVVQNELPEQSWGEAGMHQVSFEVATNAGMPFGPLSKVASGGELSRLLLAFKVVLKGKATASSIFDEIDSGTGGAVAEAIGLRLKKLAEDAQVLVVTHLPQVAALASHHLYITKSGGKAVETKVTQLSEKERAEELARMLSGATISDEARAQAGKLLQAAS